MTTVLGLVSLAASAMFFALGALARQIAGVRYWAVGCLAIGFATVLDGPRTIDHWQWASLLFNIPFGIGQAYMLTGTLDFCRHSHGRLLLPASAAVAVALTVGFTFVYPHTAWRIGTLCAYQAVFNLASAWIMFRYPDTFSRRVFFVAGTVASLQGLTALAQGGLVASSSLTFDYGAPQLPIANTISWAGALLSAVIGNSMLMLLIMLRLVSEVSAAADQDVLTGLLNRRGIRRKFDLLLARHDDEHSAVGILLLDIDEFKKVNDTHGHETGDQVIAAMGAVLRALDDGRTTASRWGGEEFCLVAEAATPRALVELAETIRQQFEAATAVLPGLAQGCTASVGVALNEAGTALDVQKLIALADAQLYRAKRGGRNRVMAAAPDGGLFDVSSAR
ncbi:GGDEF domain-containing protein [Telluria aromaticivorans]|uniref:diguanylate cyclase n=1 Tax=Telluria aromaticivorans TaxID=2725995 RepID=A0A7Y2NYK5_9BURK|nr:GGDEF domain-containing protein [Telluria aromaticivorans]NNG21596.1 GGDEF domain-containing protein [Telluria aromaticivorans]